MPASVSKIGVPRVGLRRAGIVTVAALLPYLLLPSHPLIYDAYATIVANEALREGPLARLFAVDFWGRAPDGLSLRSYRPLVSLTYAVQARTVGDSPALYHLTDMALHATAALLLLSLLSRLGIRREWLLPGALLFALHPVQTDAVCSAVGRADILAANCLLGALVLRLGAPGARRSWSWRAGAVLLLLAAALLCKEYAVAFPFIVMATDLARRGPGGTPASSERRRQHLVWLGGLLLLGGYLVLRRALFGALGAVPMGPENHPLAGQPTPVRWLTSLSLVALAVRLLVLPYGLNHHYRFGTLPIVEQLNDPRALLGLGLVLALVACGVATWLRRRDPIPIVALALVFFPLAPSLNTVSVAGVLFAERFLYIPVAGLALGVAWGLQQLKERSGVRRPVRWAVVALLLLFGMLTARRVEAWSSMERLARASVAAYPAGSEGWKQLGAALAEQGRFAEAAAAIERSIRLNPDDPAAWKVRADAAAALGRREEAAEAWRRLVELSPLPLRGQLLLRLAQERLAEGSTQDALRLVQEASELGGLPAGGLFLAGLVASSAGDPTLASRLFDHALQVDPGLLRKKHDLAQQLLEQGRVEEAIDQLHEILVARPAHAPTLFNLARALTNAGRKQEAIAALRRGLAVQEDERARRLLNELLRVSSPGS